MVPRHHGPAGSHPTAQELLSYRDFALELAHDAAHQIAAGFADRPTAVRKGDGTPITAVDVAVNNLVIDAVTGRYDHRILGEEGSGGNPASALTWVCDPIDGTIPFTTGLPLSVFSLALCHHGTPIVAVVADPHSGRTLDATIGGGTRCNGEPVKVRDHTEIDGATLDVEAWAFLRHNMSPLRDELSASGARCLTLGSTVRGALGVAAGELDGIVFGGDSPWDAAAAALLIREAGGQVTSLAGARQRYDTPLRGFMGANRALHQQLTSRLRKYLPST